jgi:hypothetical protein
MNEVMKISHRVRSRVRSRVTGHGSRVRVRVGVTGRGQGTGTGVGKLVYKSDPSSNRHKIDSKPFGAKIGPRVNETVKVAR